MKISLNWLKSYIDLSVGGSELASLLTQKGLEVSQISPTIKNGLEGLLIGEIIAWEPHSNADKLNKVLVNIGQESPLSIVCGATNLQVGLKVVVAPVGATIYHYSDQSQFQIKKVKIRGEWSEGMICSEEEIGLPPTQNGILILHTNLPAGTPAKHHFKEEIDEILDIEITPNRGDACSHLGIAREVKAIFHLPIHLPSVDDFKSKASSPPLKINCSDPTLCPRYCGLLLKNIVIQPSPSWLRSRLEYIGGKSINNIVDITNFVLYELGQPLHAFDYELITGNEIKIKQLNSKECFKGLDGIERKLTGDELMICDKEGPMAMAGIMGGFRTQITEATRHIFIESAYFNPTVIRRATQYHNLKTEASFRFERGTDPNMPLYALKRAALLVQTLIPNVEISEIIEFYPKKFIHSTIPITYASITRSLGEEISPSIIKKIVTDLEIEIENESKEGFTAKVPPYRVDVTRRIDLIEEIARIYGYDNICTTEQLSTIYLAPETNSDNAYKVEQDIGKILMANRYYEIWTNSLINGAYETFIDPATNPIIPILNPPSTSVNILRPSLLFSGLEVIAYNIAHRHCDLKLFEFGTTYSKEEAQYKEEKKLALWLTGQIEPTNWIRQLGPVTLQELRTTIDQLTQRLGIKDLSYKEKFHSFYKQALHVKQQEEEIITLGQVHPSLLTHFLIKQPVFFADINWKHFLKISHLHKLYEPVSKFPAVKRDLSLLVDKSILFQQIKDLVLSQKHKSIQSISLFNVYEGENLPQGKKSYAINFTLQDKEKTLDNKDIDRTMNELIQVFERDLNAIIRR